MEEREQPRRASKAVRPKPFNDDDIAPVGTKRDRDVSTHNGRKKTKHAPPASLGVVLQRMVWGGLAGWCAFSYLRYEMLLQKKDISAVQECSISGFFLVEVLIAFVVAFSLCEVIKLWTPQQPIEVFTKSLAEPDAN